MSEYQYYEFRAIDRTLKPKEMDELRALSTRAEITLTSFTNTYNYGDFRGNPATLMDRYFDAFVYVANWGTHQLMFRIPAGFLDSETALTYCDGETLSLKAKQEHVVLDFSSEDEDYDGWTQGEHWMPSLISLRADLIRGDLRALYLGWLASLRFYDGDEEDLDDGDRLEPVVPPGLSKLSPALRDLASFLRVDEELIEAAAAGSTGEPPAGPSQGDMARWVKKLPASDKDAYLVRFLTEEGDIQLRAELSKRFREATLPKVQPPTADPKRRTVAELLAVRKALVEEKERQKSEQAAKDRVRIERERAEARAKHLDDLARREPATWLKIETLIATKRAQDYDEAVSLLVDLRDLAERSGRLADAEQRIQEIRHQHRNKPSLLKRFDSKKLGQ
jgi:hypothetical protein